MKISKILKYPLGKNIYTYYSKDNNVIYAITVFKKTTYLFFSFLKYTNDFFLEETKKPLMFDIYCIIGFYVRCTR